MRFAVIAAVVLSCAFAVKFLIKKTTPQKVSVATPYSGYLSCEGYPFDTRIKFTGEVILLKKGIPESEEEKRHLFGGSAYYQNLYTFTNVPHYTENPLIKGISLGNRPDIRVVKTEDVEYPFYANFEREKQIIGFPEPQLNYLNKIITTGEAQKGEPALKVTYEYENDLFICLSKPEEKIISSLKFVSPIDPFLTYFMVPMEQRRPVTNPVYKATATVNPCLNPEAVAKIGVAEFAYWYHWKPFLEGQDADKVRFDCGLYYQEGKSIRTIAPAITIKQPKESKTFAFENFDNLQRPISLSVHFGGFNNYEFAELDATEVKDLVTYFLSGIDFKSARARLPYERYDHNLSTLLILLWNLQKHIDIKDVSTNVHKQALSVVTRGKFKLSKRDIEVKLFLLPNSPGNETADTFAENFSEALLKDDVVLYEGHAAYGQTLRGGIEKARGKMARKQSSPLSYQILGLMSCNTNYYYNPDEFPKASDTFRRDIIFTGGDYYDNAAVGSLAVISSIDSYLYNEAYVQFGDWAKVFKSENFYILVNR